jgi:ABC-type glycerol-3-phosphate transport system permease component
MTRAGVRSGARFDPLTAAAVIIALALLCLPWLWAVLASFQPEARLFEGDVVAWPAVTEHYAAVLRGGELLLPLRNSLLVASATTALCLLLGSACAYALARLPVPGRRTLLAGLLAVSMFPQIAIVSPLYLMLRALHLINSFPGLILPYVSFAMPLTVWLLVGFFRQIPAELEEAARVDGASRVRILFEIVAPLAAPALATTAILVFIYCWNEFLFALSFTLGPERFTVPVAIALFRSQYQVSWGQVLAAAVISTAPVMALLLLFQRRIVAGLTAGAVKG